MSPLKSSVVLCTRNRLQDVLKCLPSIAAQTSVADELIVVDSSDVPLQDNTDFLALFNERLFPYTKLVYQHTSPGLTYQRNVGISLATGDVLYFFDDDTELMPDYLQKMQIVFALHPEYAGGMGSVRDVSPKQNNVDRGLRTVFLLQRDHASGNFTASGMPTHAYGLTDFKQVQVLGGCNMAFRASVLTKHTFDENLRRYAYMEDCDISRRVSYDAPLFYNPSAQLYHYASPLARDRVLDNRAMYIKNYSYLFFKNFYPRNRLKVIAYAWSVVGLFVQAVAMRNADYLKGYCKGLREFYKK